MDRRLFWLMDRSESNESRSESSTFMRRRRLSCFGPLFFDLLREGAGFLPMRRSTSFSSFSAGFRSVAMGQGDRGTQSLVGSGMIRKRKANWDVARREKAKRRAEQRAMGHRTHDWRISDVTNTWACQWTCQFCKTQLDTSWKLGPSHVGIPNTCAAAIVLRIQES
ncbi:MAG: hypothetical protein BWY99_01865 [Synergistetes bacterium ADurb.BinA166]|nr:MAG: hypothetical protein BWY99_01865 [Synergistetes bacterium ADurb.BinA166]